MSDRVPNSGTKAAYSPPTLTIYGGLSQLTAGGSAGGMEFTADPLPTRKQ